MMARLRSFSLSDRLRWLLLGLVLVAGLVGASTASARAGSAESAGRSHLTAERSNRARAEPPSRPQGACPCEVYVTVSGLGTVTVTGIDCPGTCPRRDDYNPFQETLTATPASGQVFHGWGDACSSRGSSPTCTFFVGGSSPSYVKVSASFTGGPSLPTVSVS